MKNMFWGDGPLPGPQGSVWDICRKHIFGGGGPLPGPQGVRRDMHRTNIFGVGDHPKVSEGTCTFAFAYVRYCVCTYLLPVLSENIL